MGLYDSLMRLFVPDLGIDLGTANTLVAVQGRGVILAEPSVVAVKKGTRHVEAVGDLAKVMIGKNPASIDVVCPMKDGVINDLAMTEAMLTYFIAKAGGKRGPFRPRLMVAVPSGLNEVEKGAVTNSAMKAGAREVYLIKEPLAAAIGAGLPVAEPVASMIVDIGGGTTEVAVISLAGIVVSESVRCAGNEFDHTILTYVKQKYGVAIGDNTAEQIKVQIGCAIAPAEDLRMTVRGRDLRSGMPTEVELGSREISEALAPRIDTIVHAVKMVLERTAPELSSDLIDRGITMAGGSCQLRGLAERIAQETNLPVRLAQDPMTCVARGCAALLDNLDTVKDILEPGTRG